MAKENVNTAKRSEWEQLVLREVAYVAVYSAAEVMIRTGVAVVLSGETLALFAQMPMSPVHVERTTFARGAWKADCLMWEEAMTFLTIAGNVPRSQLGEWTDYAVDNHVEHHAVVDVLAGEACSREEWRIRRGDGRPIRCGSFRRRVDRERERQGGQGYIGGFDEAPRRGGRHRCEGVYPNVDSYAAPLPRRELVPRETPPREAIPSGPTPVEPATSAVVSSAVAEDATLACLLLRDTIMRTFGESAVLLEGQGTMLGSSTLTVKECMERALDAAKTAKRSHETAFGPPPTLSHQPGPPAPAAVAPGAYGYASHAPPGYDPYAQQRPPPGYGNPPHVGPSPYQGYQGGWGYGYPPR